MTPRELALDQPAAPVALPTPGGRSENGKVIPRRRRGDWGWPSRDGVVRAACESLAEHDARTATHSDDVVALAHAIAEQMDLPPVERRRLLAGAQLHDIGKLTVPRDIIEKDGPLDAEEWALIREHTVAGERILRDLPEVVEVAEIVRSSHERYDGRGYPDGLARDQIPLASRIIFCADAFHAMRSDRPYRAGRSAEEAIAELRTYAGTQFDPQVVDALVAAAERLRRSRLRRARGLVRGRMPRRALALLLALSVAGSAAAATRGPVEDLLGGGGKEPAAGAACAGPGPCAPAQLGPLGDPFPGSHVGVRSVLGVEGAPRPRSAAVGARHRQDATAPGGRSARPAPHARPDAPASTPGKPAAGERGVPSDPEGPLKPKPAPVREKSPGKPGEPPAGPVDPPGREVIPERLDDVKLPDRIDVGPVQVDLPRRGDGRD